MPISVELFTNIDITSKIETYIMSESEGLKMQWINRLRSHYNMVMMMVTMMIPFLDELAVRIIGI